MEQQSEILFNTLVGTILYVDRQPQLSLSYFRKVAEITDDVQLLENTLLAAIGVKDWATAIPMAEKLADLSPSDPRQFRKNLALLYVQAGEYDKAIKTLDIVLSEEVDPLNADTFMAIGSLLARHADEHTMQFMDDLVERYPDHATAHLTRAILAFQMKDYDAAIESATRAEESGGDKDKTAIVMAEAWVAKGQVDKGLALVSRQLLLKPDDIKLRNYYATRLLEHGYNRQALSEYQTLNDATPDNAEVLMKLGYLYLQDGQVAQAEPFFHRVKHHPDYAEQALYYLGVSAEKRNAVDDALSFFARIRLSDSQLSIDALVARAQIYYARGARERATQLIAEGLEAVDNPLLGAQIYLSYGHMFEREQRYDEALLVYTQGLENTSLNFTPLLLARALASYHLKRLDDAEADLKRILLKQPNNYDALNALGYMLADFNVRIDEAEQYVRRAYQLKPDSPEILDSMGWVAFRKNDLETAERFLRMALAKLDAAEIIGHLVEVLRRKCELQEANALLARGLTRFPNDAYLSELNRPYTCSP